MTPTYTVETGKFMRLVNELAAATRRTAGTIIKTRAGTMARFLAEATMPVGELTMQELSDGSVVEKAVGLGTTPEGRVSGTGQAIRQMGRNALLKDLSRVYAPASAIFAALKTNSPTLARAAYAALKKGKWNEMRSRLGAIGGVANLEWQEWDSGARHRQFRRRGRVPKSVKPVVVGNAEFKDYKQKLAGGPVSGGRVGLAKSAWVQASYKITGKWPRGVPAWMKQPAPSRAHDNTRNTSFPAVHFESLLDYASDALRKDQFGRAMFRLEDTLQKDFEIQLQKIADRAAQQNK